MFFLLLFYSEEENLFLLSLESPPPSELEFAMETLGGNPKRNTDLESGNQPKKTRRRHLLHNAFDFIAIAVSK